MGVGISHFGQYRHRHMPNSSAISDLILGVDQMQVPYCNSLGHCRGPEYTYEPRSISADDGAGCQKCEFATFDKMGPVHGI